jgi:hypothetical protein
MELMRKRPDWMNKRHKYALLTEGRVVICLARRHLDALKWLQVLFSRSNARLSQDRNTSPLWSSYDRIWFSGPDKQKILILI